MSEWNEWYEVEFKYYQYNSGKADNGIYTHSSRFDTVDEALVFEKKLNDAFKVVKNNDYANPLYDWQSQLIMDISYAGFLKSGGTIYRHTKVLIAVERKHE